MMLLAKRDKSDFPISSTKSTISIFNDNYKGFMYVQIRKSRICTYINPFEKIIYLPVKRYKIPYIIEEKRSISIILSMDTKIEKVDECSAAPVTDCTREPLTA